MRHQSPCALRSRPHPLSLITGMALKASMYASTSRVLHCLYACHARANFKQVAAWISIIIVLVVCLNIFAVSIYGEAEFIFASVKIITIVGLLILALIIDVGGVPGQKRLGFATWRNPGAMKEYVGHGDTGRFTGFFSTLVNAAFSYGGVEMVAVAAGEAENPRKNIPKAARRVFWRK